MKRLHVHVGVTDLPASIRFYSTLFGAEPRAFAHVVEREGRIVGIAI